MIKAGIVGVTGYAGAELFRLLASHPQVEIASVVSNSYGGQRLEDIFFNLKTDLICRDFDEPQLLEKLAAECDVLFFSLPHGLLDEKLSRSKIDILENCKIIDLGADFRFEDSDTYKDWYNRDLQSKDINAQAVYGLCEIHREVIKKARIVANPGCYTTASILALYPLLKEKIIRTDNIIIDAKSGVSGAGRGLALNTHFCERDENIKAYKVIRHRHTPEIEEQLGLAAGQKISLTFVPHLVPMNRGILATIYASPNKKYSHEEIKSVYEKYYIDEKFIRIYEKGFLPETRWVKGSNYVQIGFEVNERTNTLIVLSAIDNLFKGAAGQAVQNMNLMFGFEESEGLDFFGGFPL